MTGFLQRIGHQITQCAPVSAFAWIASQGGAPAGAAVNALLPAGGEAATGAAGAAAAGAPAVDDCPAPEVGARSGAEVAAGAPATAAAAPATAAPAPAAPPSPPDDPTAGAGDGPATSYIVGPRIEYHGDFRQLHIDDRDTTVSQHIIQRIVAGGDVTTEIDTLVGSGDHSSTASIAVHEAGAGAVDGPDGPDDTDDPGQGAMAAADGGDDASGAAQVDTEFGHGAPPPGDGDTTGTGIDSAPTGDPLEPTGDEAATADPGPAAEPAAPPPEEPFDELGSLGAADLPPDEPPPVLPEGPALADHDDALV